MYPGRYTAEVDGEPDRAHLPAWRELNRRVRDSGDVGIWHETYRVQASGLEAIYGDLPRFGLAAAFGHVPVSARTGQSAARRIGARSDDLAAVAPYDTPAGG